MMIGGGNWAGAEVGMDGQPSTARIDAVLERVARRYRSGSRFTRHYVSGKLRRDPVHRDVLALAGDEGFGEVVDVGCGRGQLGLALLEAGAATRVLGLDRDFNKLAEAGRAASGLRFSAMGVDLARSVALPPADTVLLIDVLYQLPTEAQAAGAAGGHAQRPAHPDQDPGSGPPGAVVAGPGDGARAAPGAAERRFDGQPAADCLAGRQARAGRFHHHSNAVLDRYPAAQCAPFRQQNPTIASPQRSGARRFLIQEEEVLF